MLDKFRNKNKEYEYYQYWIQRGKNYQKNYVETENHVIQEFELMRYLEKVQFESVLEFGCGFGRMTKLIAEKFSPKKYTAIDLSQDQIRNAEKNCKEYRNINFQVSSINDLQIKEKFDLVLGANVLLHIPPSNINSILQKLKSLTKKRLIHLDWYPIEKPEKIASHNFIHQYPELYKEIDKFCDINIKRINEKQCIFDIIFKNK